MNRYLLVYALYQDSRLVFVSKIAYADWIDATLIQNARESVAAVYGIADWQEVMYISITELR